MQRGSFRTVGAISPSLYRVFIFGSRAFSIQSVNHSLKKRVIRCADAYVEQPVGQNPGEWSSIGRPFVARTREQLDTLSFGPLDHWTFAPYDHGTHGPLEMKPVVSFGPFVPMPRSTPGPLNPGRCDLCNRVPMDTPPP